MQRDSHFYSDCVFDTVFIGGGTPSLMSASDTRLLLNTVKGCFNLTQDVEFSIEANPGTLDRERLIACREGGVNRLSIGLQSANDSELYVLGRIHTLGEFEKTYSLARECGFENINIDIMYALPNQTIAELEKTLEYVCSLSVEHISAYCLKIEQGTPFFKRADTLCLPDEDTQYEMYMRLCDVLKSNGYEQYEISNFSKNGRRCMHNMKYWLSHDYVGFGPSAHSFLDGKRYFYENNTDKYISCVKAGASPLRLEEETHDLGREEKMDEYIMLAMRLCDGVDAIDFKNRFGCELLSIYDFDKYIKSGHIIKKGNAYAFTPAGFFVSNYILSDLLNNI